MRKLSLRRKYFIRGQLHEVVIVTQMKDGCVWRTEAVGEVIARRTERPLRPLARASLGSISYKDMPEI